MGADQGVTTTKSSGEMLERLTANMATIRWQNSTTANNAAAAAPAANHGSKAMFSNNKNRIGNKKNWLLAAALAGIAGSALGAADRYAIDPTHTFPSLEFDHMGLSTWRGKFDKTRGTISIDRAAKTGEIEVEVDMASINFGLGAMDEQARSEDFFTVAKFPTGSYKGTLEFDGDTPNAIDGAITLLGVTRPVRLTIGRFKCMLHPMLKQEVCGADAEGELNWSEFGMKMSQDGQGDAGKVRLRIQVEALKQN
jgi:polyisoprenoid-binding protein YceI